MNRRLRGTAYICIFGVLFSAFFLFLFLSSGQRCGAPQYSGKHSTEKTAAVQSAGVPGKPGSVFHRNHLPGIRHSLRSGGFRINKILKLRIWALRDRAAVMTLPVFQRTRFLSARYSFFQIFLKVIRRTDETGNRFFGGSLRERAFHPHQCGDVPSRHRHPLPAAAGGNQKDFTASGEYHRPC